MSTQLRLRRGNTLVTSTFVGALGEVTVDTDLYTFVVHDGVTPGGHPAITGTNNFMVDRGSDPNNWDTLTTMGVYLVNRISWSGTTGTPTDTTNYNGLLEVINTQNTAITQNYRPYDNGTIVNNYWTRSKFSTNPWSSWTEIINSAGVTDGGSY